MMTNVPEVFRLGPFQHHVESFVDHLRAKKYALHSVALKKSIIMAFARWSQSQGIGIDDLSENYLAAFVKRRPRRPASAVEMRALRQFLRHLLVERGLPVSARGKSASPVDDLTEQLYSLSSYGARAGQEFDTGLRSVRSRLSCLSIG